MISILLFISRTQESNPRSQLLRRTFFSRYLGILNNVLSIFRKNSSIYTENSLDKKKMSSGIATTGDGGCTMDYTDVDFN